MAVNLPIFFGELLVGGFMMYRGSKDVAVALGTSSSSGSSPSSTAGVSTIIPTSPQLQAGVSSVAKTHGWSASETAAWLGVIGHEDASGSLTAKNPTSNAYGIAQFINGPSEYAQYGGDVNTLRGQLTAMANYIKERYGTPSAALAHENSFGWY